MANGSSSFQMEVVPPLTKSPVQECMELKYQGRLKDISTLQLTSLTYPGIILGMGSANERWRYIVMLAVIGLVHSQNYPWILNFVVQIF